MDPTLSLDQSETTSMPANKVPGTPVEINRGPTNVPYTPSFAGPARSDGGKGCNGGDDDGAGRKRRAPDRDSNNDGNSHYGMDLETDAEMDVDHDTGFKRGFVCDVCRRIHSLKFGRFY